MRPVPDSARWATGLTGSYTLAVRITTLSDGAEVTEGITGSVTLDNTADTRGRLDLTLVGTLGLVPDSPTDPLAPYGQEIKVERGMTYADGTTDYVSLGIFRIDDTNVDDSGESLNIQIQGLDRSARIIEADFENPYSLVAGTNFATAILSTLQAVYPDIQTSFAVTSLVTPLIVAQEGEDRWAFCRGLAEAIGMELYFDGDGICVLRPVSGVDSTAVYTLAEGEDGVLLNASRRWTRQGTANRWIVTGENPDGTDIPRGVATDDAATSPTRYGGPYGTVPFFQSYSEITTTAQAQDAANGLKAKNMGTSQQVDFGAVVNPALEPDDVARITRQRTGIDENHVLDSVVIPLTATDAMSGQTRAVIANA